MPERLYPDLTPFYRNQNLVLELAKPVADIRVIQSMRSTDLWRKFKDKFFGVKTSSTSDLHPATGHDGGVNSVKTSAGSGGSTTSNVESFRSAAKLKRVGPTRIRCIERNPEARDRILKEHPPCDAPRSCDNSFQPKIRVPRNHTCAKINSEADNKYRRIADPDPVRETRSFQPLEGDIPGVLASGYLGHNGPDTAWTWQRHGGWKSQKLGRRLENTAEPLPGKPGMRESDGYCYYNPDEIPYPVAGLREMYARPQTRPTCLCFSTGTDVPPPSLY